MTPENYKLKGFEISLTCGKKYDGLIQNKKTGKIKRVAFGDLQHEHFKDKALGLFSHLDHNDPKRRTLYQKRHGAQGFQNIKYSPAWFSWRFLW